MLPFTRRQFLSSATALAGTALLPRRAAAAPPFNGQALAAAWASLEKQSGGRLGVAFLDTGTGAQAGWRSGERLPMCSTHKLLTAGAVLQRVDQGKEHLDRIVPFGRQDLMPYSPATQKHLGGMSVRDLCAAVITLSDNTAANLLLASIGGPAGYTAWARSLGDPVTRLDRNEPTLNECLPGDPRDTTTPEAMLADLRRLVLGDVLRPASRAPLTQWLIECKTGTQRIRAGLPAGWKAGDKTGTGERGTANDVAVIWPTGGAPLLLAVYLTGATVPEAQQSALIASVARATVAAMSSSHAG